MITNEGLLTEDMNLFERIGVYHFPITAINENTKKEYVAGTCLFIKIDSHVFLITAAHVMNERHKVKDKTLWLWNFHDNKKIEIIEDIYCDPGDSVPHHHDVAILKVDITRYFPCGTDMFDKYFCLSILNLFDRLNPLSEEGDETACLVVGYPSSKNKIINTKNFKKRPKLLQFLAHFVPSNNEHVSTEEVLTIRAQWADEILSNKADSLPKPNGISGGGMWFVSKENGQYKIGLAGIAVAHIESEKCVIGVNILFVLSMIKYFFPEVDIPQDCLPIEFYSSGDDVLYIIPEGS